MAKKDKSRQKKFDTRIDFTPMVDMNMLLITFFMLCTTMLKSATVELALPTNDKVDENNQTEMKESEAVTFIIDGVQNEKGESKEGEGMIYYYEGKPDVENNNLVQLKFDKEGGNTIREMLEKRNEDLLREYRELKLEKEKTNMPDTIFKKKAAELRVKIKKDDKAKKPTVAIKPTPTASYADVVRMLDEMQINQISTWQVETLNDQDKALLSKNGINVREPETPK